MKSWQNAALTVLITLLVVAVALLTAVYPRGQEITLLPAPSPSPIMVHVSGEVNSPGVYSLPWGSRTKDAIQAAGGFKDGADVDSVNLAKMLLDGDQVSVAAERQTVGSEKSRTLVKESTAGPISGKNLFPLDINTATVTEIEQLPGIGPTKAGLIVAYREQHGAFKTIEEIQNVSTIGQATFVQIKDLIIVK